jgi:hypothetical protein
MSVCAIAGIDCTAQATVNAAIAKIPRINSSPDFLAFVPPFRWVQGIPRCMCKTASTPSMHA